MTKKYLSFVDYLIDEEIIPISEQSFCDEHLTMKYHDYKGLYELYCLLNNFEYEDLG